MKCLRSLVSTCLLTALAGCAGPQFINAFTPDEGYALTKDLVYDPATGEKLDVYSPPNARAAPVVVFFFGGRWEQGDKQEYKFVGQALAARGFVAVIPNYRLYPQVRYPAFLQDCARAVVWVHANIARFGGDPGKLVLMGHSTGAYNAAMLTLDPEFLQQAGGARDWIRGMIGLAGPYDFLPITDPDLRDLFGPPENFPKTQPVLYVDGRNPPVLLMHGEQDQTVPVRNTDELYARIQRAGGPAEKVLYPKLDHKWLIADVATRYQGYADVMNRIEDFVRRVTSGKAPQAPSSSIQTIVPH
jgi:acetyl esterase/lipase